MGRSKNKNKNKRRKIVKAEKRSTRVRIILTIFYRRHTHSLVVACLHALNPNVAYNDRTPSKTSFATPQALPSLVVVDPDPWLCPFCSLSPLYTYGQCARHKNETRLFLRGSNIWTLLRTTRAIELAGNGGRVTYGWVDAISTVVICILAPSIYSKLTPFRTLDYLYRPSMKGTT